MSHLVHLTPAKGLRVIDPATGEPLPPEGKVVEWTTHWARREKDGDVEITKTSAKPVKKQ